MNLFRKIGIAILMIVPTFVVSGLLWALVESWVLVAVVVLCMAAVYGGIVQGKICCRSQHT